MARADRRRQAREAARAPRRTRAAGGGAGIAEDTLFFPRLRTHAKWVFVFLAIVFMFSFVFLGVGSGSAGIGDLLRGNFSNLFSGGNSASDQIHKAKNAIKKHPKDLQAYRDLASAYRSQGKTDQAISAYNQLLAVAPRDQDALAQVAGLYLAKGDAARSRAAAAQASTPATASSIFQPVPTSKIGQALQGTADPFARWDPINGAVSSKVNQDSQTAYSEMTIAYNAAVASYKKLTLVTPKDPSVEFQLAQAAETAGDAKSAIAAYAAFLKLAPDDPTAPAVRQRLKQLQASQQAQPSPRAGG